MPVLQRLLRILYRQVADLTWPVIAVFGGLHALLSWSLLWTAGEAHMTAPVTFAYWYMTTASTVGYGDVAPQGDLGRLVTILFVFPGAIALFTSVIAKAVTSLSDSWRKRMDGFGDYSTLTGHTILVGHHPVRTPRMVAEILAGRPGEGIVLVTHDIERNTDPRIRFVRSGKGQIVADLRRAGLAGAATVVVYADDDDETLAASLAASAADGDVAVVAYFRNQSHADLLLAHCPRSRVIVSDDVEQVVREAQDPGAGQVISLLASAVEEAAVYSAVLPGPTTVGAIEARLRDAGALLLGVQTVAVTVEAGEAFDPTAWKGVMAPDARPRLLPDRREGLSTGDRIHYVSRRRLPDTFFLTSSAAA